MTHPCSHPFRAGTAFELAQGKGHCAFCSAPMPYNPYTKATAETLILAGHNENDLLQLVDNHVVPPQNNEVYPGMTKQDLEDMAFAYCPSGKIGELMQFADVLVSRIIESQNKGWHDGQPPPNVNKAWLRVRYPNPKGDYYQVNLAELEGGVWIALNDGAMSEEITGVITGWQSYTIPTLI